MRTIPLTQGQVALVDDTDYEMLSGYKWHAQKGVNTLYAIRHLWRDGKRTTQTMHKFLTDARKTDHKDGNGLNNQRHNLRPCTDAQNLMNRQKSTGYSSKFKGVHRTLWGWQAGIRVNYKSIYLGGFTDEANAAQAYNDAAIKYFGEFARLNVLPDPTAETDWLAELDTPLAV